MLDYRRCQGTLSHRWTAGDDDKIGRLETRCLYIEIPVTGRKPRYILFSLIEVVDGFYGIFYDFAQGGDARFNLLRTYIEYELLGLVQNGT